MNSAMLAEDAVAVRQLRTRGIAEAALRQQLAAVVTPRVPRFVFVRRVTLRAEPRQIGQAMAAALAKLAEDAGQDILTFPDFPAVATSCAKAALSGGLDGWHWRTLGLPRLATPGDAIATLLIAHPLEAASVVAALARASLLAAVWQTLSEARAAQVTAALAQATGLAVPAWPQPAPAEPAGRLPDSAALLQRAQALWADSLRPLPPRSEAVRLALMLSLLQWSPATLRSPDSPVWPALLARVTEIVPNPISPLLQAPGDRRPAAEIAPPGLAEASLAAKATQPPSPEVDTPPVTPNASVFAPAFTPEEAVPHGEQIATEWGGVLFLINALRRLDVESVVCSRDPAAPTAWRLLHDLGIAFGMPQDERLARYIESQDLDTAVPPQQLAVLLDDIEALYRTDGPWPLPLLQPAVLRASETHLDLHLAATTIDVALRLSGLDLDPGWVPWLGRVVAFHYDHLPTFARPGF